MMINKETLKLYAITDSLCLKGVTLEDAVKASIEGGITCLQYREKTIEDKDFKFEQAKRLASICRETGIPFLINDDVELCIASGADGVHLGQDDMPVSEARQILGECRIVGATAHNLEEAIKAQEEGADYLGSGAAFGSMTKKDAKPISLDEYKRITSNVDIPVVAIGGINKDNLCKLEGSGVSGVAVVSAIYAAGDTDAICKATQIMRSKVEVHLYEQS